MPIPVVGAGAVQGAGAVSNALGTASSSQSGESFGKILEQALGQVVQSQATANQLAANFSVGGPVSLDQVMVATAKAELMTEAASAVVSRALTAYQSLMQTNIG